MESTAPSDRRIGVRVDLELFLNQYVRDRPYRVLTANLSETGLYVHRVAPDPRDRVIPPGTPVGLELELPGTGEVIWARAEVCRESWGGAPAHARDAASEAARSVRGTALRFADMPRIHARLVREFCHQRRLERLDALLARIRRAPAPVSRPRGRPATA